MESRKKRTIIILVLLTIVLGISSIVLSIYITQRSQSTGDADAASAIVWDAEIPKNQQQRNLYAQRWQSIINTPTFSFEFAKLFVDAEGARFKPDAPILTVQNEVLYGRDLNYYLMFNFFDKYTSSSPLRDEDVDPGIDILISDSLILQRASEEFGLRLERTFYNSNLKDFQTRNKVVEEYRERVSKLYVESIEAEAIFIWFNNSILPAGATTQSAKSVAENKINQIYEQLINNRITMQEAGALISQDQEILTKADPNASSNAYVKISAEKGGIPPLKDPALVEQLFALGEGQYSRVLIGKLFISDEEFASLQNSQGFNPESRNQELFFTILKVNSRSLGRKYQTTEEFLDKEPSDSITKGDSEVLIQKER